MKKAMNTEGNSTNPSNRDTIRGFLIEYGVDTFIKDERGEEIELYGGCGIPRFVKGGHPKAKLLRVKGAPIYFTDLYTRMGEEGNPDYINALKADNATAKTGSILQKNAASLAYKVLQYSLSTLVEKGLVPKDPTVCYVPRAKREEHYVLRQLIFKHVLRDVVTDLGYNDGIDYIRRVKNMPTTHRKDESYCYFVGNPQIEVKVNREENFIAQSCSFSEEIRGKDIILVDDIYTYGVGIDEYTLLSLLEAGAKSVVLYALACTKKWPGVFWEEVD